MEQLLRWEVNIPRWNHTGSNVIEVEFDMCKIITWGTEYYSYSFSVRRLAEPQKWRILVRGRSLVWIVHSCIYLCISLEIWSYGVLDLP